MWLHWESNTECRVGVSLALFAAAGLRFLQESCWTHPNPLIPLHYIIGIDNNRDINRGEYDNKR